ncbi:MAG: hypothetical protein M1815_005300 [Lichina confinis]|nr:MAG: hypothetical protein M1815_005300 [Lichina confinis]
MCLRWLLKIVLLAGVSFRAFTQQKAKGYGLTGWVRNVAGDKVEGEVQGEDESVQKLLRDIDRGPRLAHVVKLETTEKGVKADEAAFDVR